MECKVVMQEEIMACLGSKQQLLYDLKVENFCIRKLLHDKNLSVFLPEYISKHEFDHGYEQEMAEEEEEDDVYQKGFDKEVDIYSSDEFRMYDFKVRRCMRGRSHDWTDCPFAHPGEKARRRDPRRNHYSGAPCPDFRSSGGACPRGDACELAHGVFECWLHPACYRTMPCKEGRRCRRKVCFFAHTLQQLRVLPPHNSISSSSPPQRSARWLAPDKVAAGAALLSPTSTLINLSSPPESPPISPSVAGMKHSCYKRKSALEKRLEKFFAYDALYEELLASLKAMELSAAESSPTPPHPPGRPTAEAAPVQKSYGIGCGGGRDGGPDLEWVEELLM